MPHIAHFIPYTGTAMGGPVQGMAAYVGLLAGAGYPVTVYSASKRTDGESVGLDSRVRLVQGTAAGWGGFRRNSGLWRQAQQAEIDLVHSYGLWTDVNRLAGDIARRRGLPHLLAPCGMLAPGALRHHGWKKIPVRFWFQDRALREAQCLHAKSDKECEDIRRFGLRNPVAIIPNPVSAPPPGGGLQDYGLPDNGTLGREQRAEVGPVKWRADFTGQGGQRAEGSGQWSGVPGRRTVLFLGRLHPVKGLPRLLQAWARIQESVARGQWAEVGGQWAVGRGQKSVGSGQWAVGSGQWSRGPLSRNWQLVLAGPDEAGHRKEYEARAAELGCGDSVIFTGELDETRKWAALMAADLFVMPSDFENFGNAIVEALSCGVPVITTTGTPWKELPSAGAGWCVEPTVEALTAALREALALPEEKRQGMHRQAADFAKQFRPERAGADLIQVYQWLLGRGPKPGCVVL